MQNKYVTLLFISIFTIALDLVTKFYIHTYFALYENVSVVPGFFNITYARNPGAAFGFLAQSPSEFRTLFFAIMPPLVCLFIFGLIYTLPKEDRSQLYALSLIMGGAIGNYINRMQLGYVVDFLDVYISQYHWPTFNFADVAMTGWEFCYHLHC